MSTQPTARVARMRRLSLIIIAAAVVGFIANSEMKTLHRVAKARFTQSTSSPWVAAISSASPHTVEVWAVDEEMGYQWADLDASVTVLDDTGTTVAAHRFVASESAEKGGVKRAQTGKTLQVPLGASELHVTVSLIKGDYVDIEVYRDLPAWRALAPGVFVLLGFAGVVLFLKSRAQ
ncbi:hypothetical protein [Actomonas aquatica]|uniref:DUF3592 domain-containing protein n=1 Tax=Actomonas aquatica TaxID=2866162 RepID=A0ABZ1C951_9BACT|nr:hypothetical protein [Opitutus sp. WL0086]WRQ88129.1 hypothetical protein K1X11_001835 [Opitutus sp. WL0086]